ncbi:hypothetical protein CKM354_001223900 [Cercospora kikuchii]|uniref:Uncharacterized protein n=1 Tax=Cercospora kikuchii TaxID=84275 RepID=A0A9P3FLM0_9PEZI|nr:uncharacterized protein CKM354_001223900 [Cercospora kikuchii]GIZ49204.1 hypothetical protein CKM354_001223900 [Cercospora kikuchii]
MPSTIAYDPSLSFASVISNTILDSLVAIANAQQPVEAARDKHNSLVAHKRSLEMTKTELKNLGVETGSIERELEQLNKLVLTSAAEYEKAKIIAEPQIARSRESIRTMQRQMGSPVDQRRTGIKTLPISADSMNMKVKYLPFDSVQQNSTSYASNIASFVSESIGTITGLSNATKLGATFSAQVAQKWDMQSIEGTLIFSMSCTHKNASLLAPLVLNPDKGIKIWNQIFPANRLDPTYLEDMKNAATEYSDEKHDKYYVATGTTFGSGFIGMVHVVKTPNSSRADALTSAADQLDALANASMSFNVLKGVTGLDEKFGIDMKRLFAEQNIESHVTAVTIGATAAANGVADMSSHPFEVKGDFGPFASNTMGVEGLMRELNDYLQRVSQITGGMPLTYYLKEVGKQSLAQWWWAKYYPGKYHELASAHDCG